MDREISIEERRKESRKKRLYVGGVFLAVVASVAGLMMLLGESVKENDLLIKKAELASLESSVSASGKIVPLYEQAIVSPVATRIIEVYCNEGDTVEADQSLLKLDLQSAETDLRRISDEVSMKKNEIEQASLANATYLTDLEMKIKVKEMSVSHLKAEVAHALNSNS